MRQTERQKGRVIERESKTRGREGEGKDGGGGGVGTESVAQWDEAGC